MNARRRLTRLFIGVLALSALTVGPAPADDYVAGTTVVARGGTTLVDLGLVECNTGVPSVGGACIPWSGGGSAIEVVDDQNGRDVAFQACVDNDGNSFCGGVPTIAGCDDDIAFSHFDNGTFSNPLAAPTGFRSGCPGGFPGWVVFLCQGAHAVGAPHTHEVTTGTITSAASGGPSGEFCGGQVVGKPYVRSAIPNGCAVQGTMILSTQFVNPPASRTASFSVSFTAGTCSAGMVTMSGTLTGSCFEATGQGQFSSGRKFTLTWVGGVMELTPMGNQGGVGTLSVTPDTASGQSCLTGASRFIVAGVLGHP